jgi:predicted MPP superfamily phosphohydrolase
MRPGFPLFLIVIFSIILIIDLYAFRGVRILTGSFQPVLKNVVHLAYWSVPVLLFILTLIISAQMREVLTTSRYKILYLMIGIIVSAYFPKLVFIVFQLLNDLTRTSGYLFSKINLPFESLQNTQIITKVGFFVSLIPFLAIIHGIIWGRFNYKVKEITLESASLPKSFEGFRILQVSDWHIGSFKGHEEEVKKSVDLINAQNADIIFFTGDIVNNIAEELQPFIPVLNQLKAPMGIYSILGNHDYGEYISWPSQEAHSENMNRLYEYEGLAGFRLLRNESVIIKKDNDSIGVAGVENWGLPPFPQYGNLNIALEKIKDIPFKIVLSHDPSHWDAEILRKTNVNITLSGHTHAMQFGINLPGLKWSPVKWKYPRWEGLYQEGEQYLYVNVGIGYIAFPGRVGFNPEITVFQLKQKN